VINYILNRRAFLKQCAAAAGVLSLSDSIFAQSKPKHPNILFILADDLGWMDSSLYGSQYYETPNLKRLAQRGMMFTNAYAANPLCSPTRASILTGKFPARLKITAAAGHLKPLPNQPLLKDFGPAWQKIVWPRSKRFLPLEEYTLAEALKEVGYQTAFIGKWHLGHEPWWPKKQGFDINIAGGHYPGPPSYFSPYKIKTLSDGPKGEYLTDRLTDEAVKYLKQDRRAPFFLCFWHYAVHAPFQAKEAITKKYRTKQDPRGKQKCPVMASMIQSLDESIGRILDTLDERKLADDTMIIFTSDNGGNMYSDVKGQTPTNNYPLRGGKATIYEGGTREPTVIVWPGVVKPDSRCDEVITSIDYYPTILEMLNLKSKPNQNFDGISFFPLLKGASKLNREAIYCHFPHMTPATGNWPCVYVRRGNWKLIRFFHAADADNHRYELYNLAEDISETNNLAAKMPEMVKQLDSLIEQHLKETGALVPKLNPRYDPNARPPDRQSRPRNKTAGSKKRS